MEDQLDDMTYTCMYCSKECDVTEGTWPQNDVYGEPMIIFYASLHVEENNREYFEFACYDCAG